MIRKKAFVRQSQLESHNPRARRTYVCAVICLAASACAGTDGVDELALGSHAAALKNDGGDSGAGSYCETVYQGCYLDCSVTKYPESNDEGNLWNAISRDICLDNCDTAFDECRIVIFRTAPPVRRGTFSTAP
jgi:hypothetical protein